MTHRMVAATLSLVGFLLSLYLWLWKIGIIGTMACGTGSCEQVQTSPYATFATLPVALIGAIGYLGLLGVSLLGLQPRWLERREPTIALTVLSGAGVAFTGYLTYLEAYVIHAWCRWCLGSAGLILAIFATAMVGLMSVGRGGRDG